MRLRSGRKIIPEKLKLWAIIQADDYEQWIAAQVKTMTRHEAVMSFNRFYGYPTASSSGLLEGFVLTGTDRDRYLRLVELGGMNLPFVQKLTPYQVYQVVGLYELS